MTDEQVRTAIEVLKAYVAGTLATDLCDELDEAIDKAAQELYSRVDGEDYPDEYQSDIDRYNAGFAGDIYET
jgi:hypothetical protein